MGASEQEPASARLTTLHDFAEEVRSVGDSLEYGIAEFKESADLVTREIGGAQQATQPCSRWFGAPDCPGVSGRGYPPVG